MIRIDYEEILDVYPNGNPSAVEHLGTEMCFQAPNVGDSQLSSSSFQSCLERSIPIASRLFI